MSATVVAGGSIESGLALPVNIVHGTHGELILFLVLNMWPSHFGLLVLLAVVLFSKRVKRHATFANLCIAFVLAGLSSSLLVYAGKTTGPEPSRMLCLLQASLLYGMPGLTSTAALTLVLQMFFTVRAASLGQPNNDEDHFFRFWAMMAAPYIAYFVGILATAIVGAANPTHVSRNRRFFYCSVQSLPLTNTLTIFSAITLFGTLVAVAWTMVILYKTMSITKSQRPQWTQDLSLPIRIMGFGIYIIIAMSLSLLSIQSPSSPVPDLVIASGIYHGLNIDAGKVELKENIIAATVVILIFGTQRDIIHALCFWKRLPPSQVAEVYDVDLKKASDNEAGSIPPEVPKKDYPV